jgi:hypothetical protein
MMASMADRPAKALAPRTLVAEREEVVARLSDAFAHDRLNIEEFERRLTYQRHISHHEERRGLRNK